MNKVSTQHFCDSHSHVRWYNDFSSKHFNKLMNMGGLELIDTVKSMIKG